MQLCRKDTIPRRSSTPPPRNTDQTFISHSASIFILDPPFVLIIKALLLSWPDQPPSTHPDFPASVPILKAQ